MNRELPHWKPSPGLLQRLRHFNSLWLLNTILQGLFFWLLLLWSHKRVLRQSFFFFNLNQERTFIIYLHTGQIFFSVLSLLTQLDHHPLPRKNHSGTGLPQTIEKIFQFTFLFLLYFPLKGNFSILLMNDNLCFFLRQDRIVLFSGFKDILNRIQHRR